MPTLRLQLPGNEVAEFCRRNRIRRLAVFGSVVRTDFSPASDVDVMVEFHAGQTPGLRFFALQEELAAILGRPVDLTTIAAVEGSQNYLRRRSILESAVDVYAEG